MVIPGKWERKWKMAPGRKWPRNGCPTGKNGPELNQNFILATIFLPVWAWGQFLGIVQKVFSEKVSAITRMRQKSVRNASKMLQNKSCFIVKEECFKMRLKWAEHLSGRTPFGRYRVSMFSHFQRIFVPGWFPTL